MEEAEGEVEVDKRLGKRGKRLKRQSEGESRSFVEWIIFLSVICVFMTAITIAICCTCKYLSRMEQAGKRDAETDDVKWTMKNGVLSSNSQRHLNSSRSLEMSQFSKSQLAFLRVAGVKIDGETSTVKSSTSSND